MGATQASRLTEHFLNFRDVGNRDKPTTANHFAERRVQTARVKRVADVSGSNSQLVSEFRNCCEHFASVVVGEQLTEARYHRG
jgi:hypothetical protein